MTSSGWLKLAFPGCDSIQLMHSFEANIRISQPENSDVYLGKAGVNITLKGRLILMLLKKNGPIVLLYVTVFLLFPSVI